MVKLRKWQQWMCRTDGFQEKDTSRIRMDGQNMSKYVNICQNPTFALETRACENSTSPKKTLGW